MNSNLNNINNLNSINTYKDVWVFTEIQDHERVLEGSLELLTKGRELAKKLNQKLYSIVFGLNVEQYLPEIEKYGPDVIIYNKETEDPQLLKHYNGEIFPDLWEELIKQYKPSIILFAASEAGNDLAPRLAARFHTGLTSHCSDLDIIYSKEYKSHLLLMKRPAFSGNLSATIICPKTRPQMATVQQGVFEKIQLNTKELKKPKKIQIECKHELKKLKVVQVEPPTRYQSECIPIERAPVVIAGGRGLGSKQNFERLYELAHLIGAEVGATRVPVLYNWCSNERLIGQTGKVVHPDLYIAFGISGQIQHTSSIMDAKRIVSINIDPDALINEIADYIIVEDANRFLDALINKIKKERKTFC
ncbi:MAG: electron transfer flavoprotein subunit alpha/FixB family protein [Promethearchaeota archaeon]